MDLVTVIVIAVGLSMDAFAVSVASGVAGKRYQEPFACRPEGCFAQKVPGTFFPRHALRIALFFGGFQAIMPVLGWLAGTGVAKFISPWDHWAAFGLLTAVGLKMIYEAFRIESAEGPANPLNVFVLLVLAVATSIDALAVGFSFAFLKVAIVVPVVVIGLVTFVVSLVGVAVGGRLGHFFEKKIEILGGLVLIGIGVKILLEHLL